jgi:hypothetical protein
MHFNIAELEKRDWRSLDYMEKAAVLSSTGGQLAPEDAEEFIDSVVDKSAFLGKITTTPMDASTAYIDTIAIATRQFRAAVEATLAATAQTVNFSATIPRRTLTPVEVILAPDISYTFLHENIEREAAEQKIMGMVVKAFKNDMVDLSVNGDGSTASFLSINTGWIVLAEADSAVNDADCSGLGPSDALDLILEALPEEYDGMDGLAFCCSRKFRRKYRRELASRDTQLGDMAQVEAGDIDFEGIPLEVVYRWPTASVMLTPLENLHIGISKQMTVEKMLQPRKQVIEYTITAKFDSEYAYGGFISLGSNVSV